MNAGFGTEQLVRLRDLVTAGLGLAFADEQLEPLGAVATKRMHTLNLATSHEYLARLEDPEARRAELAALAQFLTVPETFFFRGEEQFRVLIDASTAKVAEHGRALRLLSAGCASGEEPYSLAIALREALRSIQDWNISIDAFDVNPSMIDAAKRGFYGRWSLRATPDLLKQRYFRAEDRTFEVDRGVKAMVRFECKNLADPASLRAEGAYDAIFCRNVLMYFDLEVARRIIRSFEKALKPTGLLFLGHAETLRGLSDDFRLCHSHEAFYYQKSGRFEAPCEPLRLPTAPTPAVAPTSWFDSIQVASRRIHSLTSRSLDLAPAELSSSDSDWDLADVLTLLREERFGEALAALRALPKSSQSDADVLLLLALALTNNGAGSEAEAACRRLLDVDAESAGGHYLLALCREHAADASGAIECDRRAIYFDATFAMAHLHLGILAKRSRDWTLAKSALERALRLLDGEDAGRISLFGGGFSRAALMRHCRNELAAIGGAS